MNRVQLDERLTELGIELPEPRAAVANYVPAVFSCGFLHISGQVAVKNGQFYAQGQVGKEVSTDTAIEAARLAAINVIAHIRTKLTDSLKVIRICSIQGYVHASTEFSDHPQIVDGASDLLVEVFGEIGRHSRIAVGASSLPFRCPVEISAVVQLG